MNITASILRAAAALAGRHRLSGTADLDNMPHVDRRWWLGSARIALTAGLDVETMAAAYADAQFGPGGWDDAPAVIRNDIRNRMQRVRDTILGDDPTPNSN